MEFSKLPETTRVKLTDESQQKLWEEIENRGGINSFCQNSGFPSSKLYNWKNKDSFLPIKLVSELLALEQAKIKAIKGKGRGQKIEEPNFNFSELNELLTRIDTSVSVNTNGTPMYQTDDIGNAERFVELLGKVGDFSYRVYSRESYYQINYPKFVHEVLTGEGFEPDKAALVDEKGDIEGEFFVLETEKFRIKDFEKKLYSREKSMRKALEDGNQEVIERIIASEAEKADRFIDNI